MIAADAWPELSRYVRSRGGLSAGSWSVDLIPGGLYRRGGVAPDVLAVEMPIVSECPAAVGLWDPGEGSEAMLSALQLAWEGHRRVQAESGSRRVSAAMARGQRRLSDHVDRLAERWGDRLDLSSIRAAGDEVVRLYETGDRVQLKVGGEVRRATVGCTSGARPEFVYLLSLPVLEVAEVA